MPFEHDLEVLDLTEHRRSSGRGRGARRKSKPSRDVRRIGANLPVGLVFTERCFAAFRAYLTERGLGHYRIFHCGNLDLHNIEHDLEGLGESGAAWEAPAPALPGGEPFVSMTYNETSAQLWEPGYLRLAQFEFVLARWHWMEQDAGTYRCLKLAAAPSATHFLRLHERLVQLRHRKGERVWQIVRGGAWNDGDPVPRAAVDDELVLSASLRARVEADVLRFFDPSVAALYRSMNVPYRRGVLLHGPPGNGKTSLIRHVGAKLPDIPCMLLRPTCGFDTDDLETVITRWSTQAPAVLVVEDLDWLLSTVNVSTFLNLLDGIENKTSGAGLLLIATTNHPEKLDPAINNRPGRFDVVVEIACPDAALRRQFFARKIPAAVSATAGVVERLASVCDGLSFAHLQEILRLSGLMAIHAGRPDRTAEDLMKAATSVSESHEQATKGFAPKLDMPFGLGHLVSAHRSTGGGEQEE